MSSSTRPIRVKITPERKDFIHWKDLKRQRKPREETSTTTSNQSLPQPNIENDIQETNSNENLPPTFTQLQPLSSDLEIPIDVTEQSPESSFDVEPIEITSPKRGAPEDPDEPCHRIWHIWQDGEWRFLPRTVSGTLERCWRTAPSPRQLACPVKLADGTKLWVDVKQFQAFTKKPTPNSRTDPIPVWRAAWCAVPKLCTKQTLHISPSHPSRNPFIRMDTGSFKIPIVADPTVQRHLRAGTVPDVIRFRRVKTGLDRADAMEPITTRPYTLDEWVELPKDGTWKVLASWNSEPAAGVIIGYVARFGYTSTWKPTPIVQQVNLTPEKGSFVRRNPASPLSVEIPKESEEIVPPASPEIPVEIMKEVLQPEDASLDSIPSTEESQPLPPEILLVTPEPSLEPIQVESVDPHDSIEVDPAEPILQDMSVTME